MNAIEAVKQIMEIRGVRSTDLANRLGLKKSAMSQRFARTNPSVDVLEEMLRVMDYKIVLVPSSTRVPDGGFEVR